LRLHPVIAESGFAGLGAAVSGSTPADDFPAPARVCADLLQRFGRVSDGRRDQGRVHPVAVVLALCAAAVVAGMTSLTAIAGWATDVPAEVLMKLYGRRSDPPSKATIWRVVTGADAAAVDAVIGAWLLAQAAARDTAARDVVAGEVVVPGTDREAPELSAIMVDGKAVRGATDTEGNQVHLLAAATHDDALVVGQVEVGAKSNEIPQFAPLLDTLAAAGVDLAHTVITANALHTQRAHADYLHERGAGFVFTCKQNQCATRRSVTSPLQVGQTRREVCWVRWLTWIRKVKGTRACQETDGRAQVPETGRRGTRAVWRRLDCLNPNLRRQQFTATGTAPGTGARRGRGVLVRPGHPSRRERCSTRAFKEMSGAPGPHYTCDRDERGITVPVRLAVTECS